MTMILGFGAAEATDRSVVGGKGAHLAALSRLPGVSVPPGFCLTTAAFRSITAVAPDFDVLLEQLADAEDRAAPSARLRHSLETVPLPPELDDQLAAALARFDPQTAFAIRSSATAEDLPTASFAGQHDSFLKLVGAAAIRENIRRCWASLFTDRAVSYRVRHGVDHRKVHMAVVVQEMVAADAAGTLFTADPISSNRKVCAIEAVIGLGDALVSGRVNPDVYRVRDGEVLSRKLTTDRAILTDAQVLQLAALGRHLEASLGAPQDIEWCLAGTQLHIVQSRPITTLFPVPEKGDSENHVYLSVGHQQMMTDAMKPLGLSVWQLTTPASMCIAGGRLFVDVTRALASAPGRAALLSAMGRADPLMKDALETVLQRGDFIREVGVAGDAPQPPAPIEADPSLVTELIARNQASVATLKRELATRSGAAVFDFILTDLQELKRILFEPRSHQVLMSAFEAAYWLKDHLEAWLGDRHAADVLMQSVPNNVTTEMGLALLDVADLLRTKPEVVAFLRTVTTEPDFRDTLATLPGGREARDAIDGWLEHYGMRCTGEIDLTRPRWSERPSTLLPLLLGHLDHVTPGAGRRRFDQGRQEAEQKELEILARVRALPDGDHKADETKRAIARVRAFMGYREYPKYGMVSRYFLYRQALSAELDRLVQERVLREADDAFFLTFQELHEVVRTGLVDLRIVDERRAAFRGYELLTPPRVLTSDGECLSGAYRRDDLPAGALVGLPVSAGTIEGRARVVRELDDAALEDGDILVTAFTDPSWTPLFVGIKGLVTEVGGLMTHGAVIAREYGLPTVVGVEHATRLIRDGQRIRVHGTDGYVELLD